MAGRRLLLVSWVVASLAVAGAKAGSPDPAGVAFFEARVRPILVEHCEKCHSAKAERLRGSLRLDTRDGWLKGGDSGPAIVPGKPDESPLVRAIRYDDPDLEMPPKGKLPEVAIRTLTEWVRRGAPDPRTAVAATPTARATRVIDLDRERRAWAYQPLEPGPLPAVRVPNRCLDPIDRPILAGLEAHGLAPSPAASPRQLIRRATFDLLGLPPTPEEIDTFLSDRGPDAYERLLDRLLASPRYGERWGRHWLDLARFAESHGFEHDYDRPTAFHYRDFVVAALNRDLPFDTFVKWQIAGDELAPADPLALKATGFLAAGVHSTQITANQVEKERYDELDDMASTIGTAMLGLTIGCARCHDHKYDPIPQRDYYRFLATFTTTVRTEVDLPSDPAADAAARAAFDREHAPLAAALARFEAEELPARFERWEQSRGDANRTASAWLTLDIPEPKSRGGATFTRQDDGSYLASGTNPGYDTYTFVARVGIRGIKSIRVEALSDPSMVKGGPGRAANGNFDLTDLRLTAAPADGSGAPVPITLRNPRASFEQAGLPVRAAIDADPKSGWAVDPRFGASHAADFEVDGELGFEGGTILTFTLDFQGNSAHAIGRPRLAISRAIPPAAFGGQTLPLSIVEALATPRADRTAAQIKGLLVWYRAADPEWRRRNKVVADHAAKAPRPRTTRALISSEGLPAVRLHTQGGDFLEATHFLKRGDPNQKQGVAPPGFLQVLMSSPDAESHWRAVPPPGSRTSFRRAAMADWICDPEQGAGRLLARVIVNRLWQHHLGRGIVATPSDFGVQGERPSHPELLDRLALDLIRGGWRLKPIHRRIMAAAVYRQSSEADPHRIRLDPDRRWFSRQGRRRLEAESIRDAMLAVSGRLDSRMFGPGTLDDAQTRRSLYFTVKRSHLVPMLLLFDAPDALQGVADRPSTTIAPQSLLLMNSPIVGDWASSFASRLAGSNRGTTEATIRAAYQEALGRPPASRETADALGFLDRQRTLAQGAGEPDPSRSALTDLCQVLMSLNEFVYVD